MTKCGARELYTELISAGLSDLLPQKKDGSGPYALGGCGGLRGIVAHANAVVAERRGARAQNRAPVAPVAPPARLTDGEKWTIAAQKDWQRRVDKQKALGVDATDEQLRTWLTTEFNEYLVSYYMMRHDPEFLRRCLVEAGLCGEEFDVAEPFEAAVALRLQKQTRLACVPRRLRGRRAKCAERSDGPEVCAAPSGGGRRCRAPRLRSRYSTRARASR